VRDALPRFDALGVAVLGISPDTLQQQKKFDEKHQLNFPLLSDSDHLIAESYGVWGEKKMYGKTFMGINRSAFLIDEKGRLSAVLYNISPKETVSKVMASLGSSL
jgi:peroxiredoxin Q/BCP